jgi:HAD superfamily hydrolase (TIGR01509 family)
MTYRIAPFDAAVFDMDGTLLDTELVFRSVAFEAAQALGYELTDLVHKSMVGSSHERSNELLVEAYGVSFPYQLFNQHCRDRMRERMEREVPIKTGAREMLSELRSRGIPLAVATSSHSEHALAHLGRAGLLDLFETVVAREDVHNPKPHPEPYLTAARRLGVAPERCLAVEDSHSGVRAAHAAGMQTVMVPDLVHPSDEVAALCVAVLESLHHLREIAFPELEVLDRA